MDAAVAASDAYAAIGRAVFPVVAPAELVERAGALERGELGEGEARRTLHDLGLVRELAARAAARPWS